MQDKTKPIEKNKYFIDEVAKVQKSIKPIDINDLIYYYKGSNEPINFNEYKGMINIFKNIIAVIKI